MRGESERLAVKIPRASPPFVRLCLFPCSLPSLSLLSFALSFPSVLSYGGTLFAPSGAPLPFDPLHGSIVGNFPQLRPSRRLPLIGENSPVHEKVGKFPHVCPRSPLAPFPCSPGGVSGSIRTRKNRAGTTPCGCFPAFRAPFGVSPRVTRHPPGKSAF